MRHSPTRVLGVRERHAVVAAAARLALFLVVEGIAQACATRLADAFHGLGFPGRALAVTVAMAWAFEAHRRYTFRDRRIGDALEGALRFVAASWACLVVEAAAARFAPGGGGAVLWLAASLLKFAFVCRWTWNKGPFPLEARTA